MAKTPDERLSEHVATTLGSQLLQLLRLATENETLKEENETLKKAAKTYPQPVKPA